MASLATYKRDLITLAIQQRILTFGTFTLKSGRQSPYFFNAGLFNTASLLTALSSAYAQTINAHFGPSSQQELQPSGSEEVQFDVIFGPAYKGIPLAASVLVSLPLVAQPGSTTTSPSVLNASPYAKTSYAFNRKEAKAHGEGGSIVGASLKGKRVLIIDDVITAGTAIREAVSIIEGEGGIVVGIVVALDREEMVASDAEKAGTHEEEGRGEERPSTVDTVRQDVGVPVIAVLTLGDLIQGVKQDGAIAAEDIQRMEQYRSRYGAKAAP